MPYQHITVEPSTKSIGAEISGIDLSNPLSPEIFKEIETALLEHLVIFFRDQDLSPERHIAFAEQFGKLSPPHPILPSLPGNEQISVFENDAERPAESNVWHSDVTFQTAPVMGSVLYCKDAPPTGGDTMWSNMYLAYESIPVPLRQLVTSLSAVHSIETFGASQIYDSRVPEKMDQVRQSKPPVEHPIVRTHPVTGKPALFVNRTFTTGIIGIPKEHSASILELLYRAVEIPEFQVRMRWKKGTIAVWDNRCTQHYAVNDYYPEYRRMHRLTIQGDVPFYRPIDEPNHS